MESAIAAFSLLRVSMALRCIFMSAAFASSIAVALSSRVCTSVLRAAIAAWEALSAPSFFISTWASAILASNCSRASASACFMLSIKAGIPCSISSPSPERRIPDNSLQSYSPHPGNEISSLRQYPDTIADSDSTSFSFPARVRSSLSSTPCRVALFRRVSCNDFSASSSAPRAAASASSAGEIARFTDSSASWSEPTC